MLQRCDLYGLHQVLNVKYWMGWGLSSECMAHNGCDDDKAMMCECLLNKRENNLTLGHSRIGDRRDRAAALTQF